MAGNYIDKWNANGQEYAIQDAGRGLPLGVATLDNNGRIPYAQLPESAVEFKGYWNANTNTPHLADGSGTKGDMYYVDVAGSQDLGSGTQYFNVGDRVLYDGTIWKNINSTAVKSVNNVLPDAQGNVDLLQNIFSFVFPVGTIYQNASNSTSPATLFGFGTWKQITDKYLACRGGTHITEAEGGTWSKTLTEENIPQHNHGGLTGTRNTGISVTVTSTENLITKLAGTGATQDESQPLAINAPAVHAVPAYAQYLGGLVYFSGQQYSTSVTDNGHNHTIPNYGSANPTAISLMPTYVGVYTWKRTH